MMIFGVIGCADMVSDSKESRLEGNRLYSAGSYAEAVGAFKNAIRSDPRDYKSHYGLAVSYDALKDYHQAVGAYKATLDVMTRTLAGQEDHAFRAKVVDSLGSCIARSDQREIETASMVKEAGESRKAEDSFILAKLYAYSGDADSAMDAYNRALVLEPKSFYINKEYGLYLVKLNQRDKAAEVLQRAYAINSKDEEVMAGLRQVGIVPGLSLKEERDLAQPPVPKGPLPEAKMPSFGRSSNSSTPGNGEAPAPVSGGAVQAPRD